MTPSAGDPCGNGDTVDFDASGEVLVCRSGVWQYIPQPPPPLREQDLLGDSNG